MAFTEPTLSDQRLWTRQDLTAAGANPLVATVGIARRTAFVRDLSLAGLSLLTTQPLAVGATVPVTISGQSGRSHPLLVEIVRCESTESGLVCLGGRFVDEASVAEARLLLKAITLMP